MCDPDPDAERIGIVRGAFYSGKVVAVLPAKNANLAPVIEVVGLTDQGWWIEIRDGFGTMVWCRLLEGCEVEDLPLAPVRHGLDASPSD